MTRKPDRRTYERLVAAERAKQQRYNNRLTPVEQGRLLDRTTDMIMVLQDIAKAWDRYEQSFGAPTITKAARDDLFATLSKVRDWMQENKIPVPKNDDH